MHKKVVVPFVRYRATARRVTVHVFVHTTDRFYITAARKRVPKAGEGFMFCLTKTGAEQARVGLAHAEAETMRTDAVDLIMRAAAPRMAALLARAIEGSDEPDAWYSDATSLLWELGMVDDVGAAATQQGERA